MRYPRVTLITGAASGLGKLIYDEIEHGPSKTALGLDIQELTGNRTGMFVDVTDFDSIQAVQKELQTKNVVVETIINCAGVNKIGYLEDYPIETYDEVMNSNARSLFYMAKVFLEDLKETKGTILNIVSNASHMPMTGSLAYNASKGAAHIMTLQLARELTRRWGITVFGISPNKLAGTGMSDDIDRQVCESRGWTPEEAKQYQLNSLLCGEETNPVNLAKFINYLLLSKENHKYLTGCIIPYGA